MIICPPLWSLLTKDRGQQPHSLILCLSESIMYMHTIVYFLLSVSHIYHLNVWQISKLKFKMWDHICCGFTTKPMCPCSTHLIMLLCWQQPVMEVLCFWLLWPADFHEKKGVLKELLNLTHVITGLHG